MLPATLLVSQCLFSLALATPAVKLEERQSGCHDVHIFLARGTSEPYPGRQSAVVSAICNGISNCGYEDINYPASTNPSYCSSVEAGITGGTSQITAYVNRCPNAKLVLSGYSQVCGFFYGQQWATRWLVKSEEMVPVTEQLGWPSNFEFSKTMTLLTLISHLGCSTDRRHTRWRRRWHRPGVLQSYKPRSKPFYFAWEQEWVVWIL